MARPTTEERFWMKVDKDGPVHPRLGTRCWIYRGSTMNGYGKFVVRQIGVMGRGGKRYTMCAHRFSWQLANGPLPAGLEVDHRCHVTLCVNPEHLRPATHAQNMQNRQRQGYRPRPNRDGSSGVLGVHKAKHGRWEANIGHNGKLIRLGTFATVAEAAAVRRAAEERYYTHN